MQLSRDLENLRQQLDSWRHEGARIGLVPTMGALHRGHLTLVENARAQCDRVVVSIFVNPTQFGEGEDLDAYPRQEAADIAKLESVSADLLWAPDVATMYPTGFATNISVSGVSTGLCGDARPGHFDGVATVVAKLFQQVQPDSAYFGEKDYQQLAVIRRMARDLDFRLDIIGVPTVRDDDGLALSSRNAYLDAAQRAAAVALPDAMQWAAAQLREGADADAILSEAIQRLKNAGFSRIDYFEMRDADNLEPINSYRKPARLFAAAVIGTTRLIDNIAI